MKLLMMINIKDGWLNDSIRIDDDNDDDDKFL